jgi:signal transduction histidine kinase
LTLRRDRFPVAPLLAEVVAEASVAAEVAGRDVTFAVDVEPPDAVVCADRARLSQVVVNLVDNAVRHGPSGGVVRLVAMAHNGSLTVEVHDDGPGIAVADRVRVFERFRRGERAADGGTGLGLAIARWVVDLHGGTIAVVDPAPRPDTTAAGCRIRLTLPA